MASSRVRFAVVVALAAAAAAALPSAAAVAQQGVTLPSPAQLEMLRRNPELIRQQIRASGLSPAQIRARLRAAGYPESALDAYLTSGQTGLAAPAPGAAELDALTALGLPFVTAEALLPVDSGLVRREGEPTRVFGVDAFRRSTTQFLPLLSGPVPPDYRLGPGDMLVLILTGEVELSHTLTVSREGRIFVPQVGQIAVATLTLAQLEDVLYTRLGRVYSGVRRGAGAATQFEISVANVRANQIYVTGEVVQPGAYQVSALGTVLTALYAAGGPTEAASVRRVEVRRHGALVDTLDLYDYLLRGDVAGDVRLETGDVVFVPLRGPRIEIAGAVVRPAIYEVRPGETLSHALGAAGGPLPSADLRALTVYRLLPIGERASTPAARAAIAVPLAAGADGGVTLPAFPLLDGDSIVVHELPTLAQSHSVDIHGMVLRPGRYPWRSGMTLRELVGLAGGPRVGADLRRAEVARMPADRTGGILSDTLRVPLDSSYLFDRPSQDGYVGPPGPPFPPAGTAPAFELEPYDRVLILKQPEFEFQRSVTVIGQVLYPGTYSLTRKDARLSDLVSRAGGLLEGAYPAGARFYRLFEYAGGTPLREMPLDTMAPPPTRDRVNVSLAAALRSPGSATDIILQPGDSLFVPEYQPTVRVSGAVVAPANVQYVEGKDAMYYLENAGGFAEDADKGRTVVRAADGSARTRSKFLFWSTWPRPGPGGEVFVPAKTPREPTNWIPVLAAVASILASTASVVISITR